MVLTCVPTLSTATSSTTVCVFVCCCTYDGFVLGVEQIPTCAEIHLAAAYFHFSRMRRQYITARAVYQPFAWSIHTVCMQTQAGSQYTVTFYQNPCYSVQLGYRRRKSLRLCRRFGCRLRRSRCLSYMYIGQAIQTFLGGILLYIFNNFKHQSYRLCSLKKKVTILIL